MEHYLRKILKIDSSIEYPNYFQILRVSCTAKEAQISKHFQEQTVFIDESALAPEKKIWLKNLLSSAHSTLTNAHTRQLYEKRLEEEEKQAIHQGIHLLGIKGYLDNKEYTYITKKFPHLRTKHPEVYDKLSHLRKSPPRKLLYCFLLIIVVQLFLIGTLFQQVKYKKLQPLKKSFHNFILIPDGDFFMGRNQGKEEEKPRRKVYLKEFYILSHEVTNLEYQQFIQESGHPVPYDKAPEAYPWNWNPLTRSYPPGKGHFPVVLVSWSDAMAYCRWYSKKNNCNASLPTEAEWEKAARGFAGLLYPWGNQIETETAIFCGNFQGEEDFFPSLAPIQHFVNGKSPFGVYDLAGNVSEWCQSSWKKDSPLKVLRGGNWDESVYQNRTTVRQAVSHERKNIRWGFRIVIRDSI